MMVMIQMRLGNLQWEPRQVKARMLENADKGIKETYEMKEVKSKWPQG